MSDKVISFASHRASACFVTDDGGVKFIGDSGKSGNFGYWSKGNGTISTVSGGKVSVKSIGDKSFRPPPTDMGKIVKAQMCYEATFALDEDGRLHVWGSLKKKRWEAIPHNVKMNDIFIDNTMWVFVPKTGGNIVILNSRYSGSPFLMDFKKQLESSTAPISNIACTYGAGFVKYADGSAYVCISEDRDKSETPSNKSFTIPKCDWIGSDGNIILWKSDGEVRSIPCSSYGRHHVNISSDFQGKIENAVDLYGDFDKIVVIDKDNCLHMPHNWLFNGEIESIQLSGKPLAFDLNYVLTSNNRIVPIRDMKWCGASMILAAFPEWADDEDFVLELVKISPSNFAHASSRLRKSVEFSKKVASFGPEHLRYVDGMLRRNRELRSYKRLYEITG